MNSVTCDVTVLDESGPIALVRGIQLRRLGAKALERLLPQASGESLFEIQWEAAASEPRELAGDWLLVGADANSGKRFTTVETIAEAKTALAGKSYLGVVHMASLHASSTESLDAARLMESQEVVCRSLLELVQLLAAESEPPRLVIATRGAQRVTGAESSVSVTQAPAWGMAMAILAEHREFRPASSTSIQIRETISRKSWPRNYRLTTRKIRSPIARASVMLRGWPPSPVIKVRVFRKG